MKRIVPTYRPGPAQQPAAIHVPDLAASDEVLAAVLPLRKVASAVSA